MTDQTKQMNFKVIVQLLIVLVLVPFMMWYQSIQAHESAGDRT